MASTSVRRVSTCTVLTQRQFVAWYRFHEGYTKDEALQKWDNDLRGPAVHREGQGALVALAVQQPVQLVR